MELVNGVPITEYCDDNHLPLRAAAGTVRPGLPGRAARPSEGHHPPRPQAHRTCWSPSTTAKPVPKVIDFGVAKATGPAADRADDVHRVRPDHRHARVHEPRAGRAQPARHRHPQRHLFAGRAALRAARPARRRSNASALQAAAFDEMLRIIREEEPPKPSTRLSSESDDRCPRLPIAANRHTEPARLSKAGARRARLDRDEGPGKGPQPPLRNGQRPGRRRRSATCTTSRSRPARRRRRIASASSSAGTKPRLSVASQPSCY